MSHEQNLGFAHAIAFQRSALGISQQELAKRTKLHPSYMSDLEDGLTNPSVESILKIADALHVSVAELYPQTGQSKD